MMGCPGITVTVLSKLSLYLSPLSWRGGLPSITAVARVDAATTSSRRLASAASLPELRHTERKPRSAAFGDASLCVPCSLHHWTHHIATATKELPPKASAESGKSPRAPACSGLANISALPLRSNSPLELPPQHLRPPVAARREANQDTAHDPVTECETRQAAQFPPYLPPTIAPAPLGSEVRLKPATTRNPRAIRTLRLPSRTARPHPLQPWPPRRSETA